MQTTRESSACQSRSAAFWWKRSFDLVLGGALLLLLLPLLLALVLIVRVNSPGPGIYRQQRVGRDGRPFEIWKLRTMVLCCDQSPHRASAADWFHGRDHAGRFKTLADPRLTAVGRWLRRTNLDELPQLVNVVRGEMSLVGPRPAIPYELEHYQPWYYERLRADQGITGLWQVSRRECLSAAEMMELDCRYVREATLRMDLEILLRTGPALVLGLREPSVGRAGRRFAATAGRTERSLDENHDGGRAPGPPDVRARGGGGRAGGDALGPVRPG